MYTPFILWTSHTTVKKTEVFILFFQTKFSQKMYFQSNTRHMYITIAFNIFWIIQGTKFHLKDIINPYNCLLKNANSSVKMSNEWQHHISLNSQFIVVLDGIICFSVQFCDNSLSVLKMHFQAFSLAGKKVHGFSSDKKILMPLLSVLFHLQNRVSFFWNFNF